MLKVSSLIITIILFGTVSCFAQNKKVVYKSIDTVQLHFTVYLPDSLNTSKRYPAMVFFFGGGWKTGSIAQFTHHAEYFSKLGIICFLAEYRIETKYHTSPFDALADAKSAMRYIRKHASEFDVDTAKIIAAGGSAGGQLAAACALVKKYNDKKDDLNFSCVPNALVLYNPVIDNGPGGYGYERVGEEYRFFSPLHNIHKGAPPTIIMIGTKDKLVPVETVKYYQTVMERVGSRCDLIFYESEGHGFFNYNKKDYQKTITDTEKFLVSLGYLAN